MDCLKPAGAVITTFDELRALKYFDYKSELDFKKLPCTSSSIQLHNLRAYYKCRMMTDAPFKDISLSHPPELYGFIENSDFLEVVLVEECTKPGDLPDPCTCKKCARETVCRCRIAGITCR